jgi:hypothetical protein
MVLFVASCPRGGAFVAVAVQADDHRGTPGRIEVEQPDRACRGWSRQVVRATPRIEDGVVADTDSSWGRTVDEVGVDEGGGETAGIARRTSLGSNVP